MFKYGKCNLHSSCSGDYWSGGRKRICYILWRWKLVKNLYKNEILPAVKNGLCATVLTQVSDVEDETNGLITYDRKVLKVDESKMQEINKALQQEFDN